MLRIVLAVVLALYVSGAVTMAGCYIAASRRPLEDWEKRCDEIDQQLDWLGR